jgi:hypothetical protein
MFRVSSSFSVDNLPCDDHADIRLLVLYDQRSFILSNERR